MGWTENNMSYEDDPAGLYREESINPLEMYWDHSVRKKNLDGAQRLARAKEIPLRDAMQLFPGKTREQLDAVWPIGTELDKSVKSIEQKRIRDTDDGGTGLDHYDDNARVMIVEIQWVEREVFYLIADEETQTKLQISEKQYQHMLAKARKVEERLGNGIKVMPPAARMTRKHYKRAFLGKELLQTADAPIKGRFSGVCIASELDRNKGHWFGLVKIMRDPQMWSNKWFSRILHILNTMAKGGIVAEMNAFEGMMPTYAHRRHGQDKVQTNTPKTKWNSTMTRSRRKELDDRFAYRERLDKEQTRKWLREHAPNPEPALNPKPPPLERWQKRLKAQGSERRLLAKPLLKGVG
jgi:hypothetical protein